jgi:hypothetical protein
MPKIRQTAALQALIFQELNDGPLLALLVTVAFAKIKDDIEDRKRLRRVKDDYSSGCLLHSQQLGERKRN